MVDFVYSDRVLRERRVVAPLGDGDMLDVKYIVPMNGELLLPWEEVRIVYGHQRGDSIDDYFLALEASIFAKEGEVVFDESRKIAVTAMINKGRGLENGALRGLPRARQIMGEWCRKRDAHDASCVN